MSQSIRKSSQVAKRYANSLLDLAQEKPGLETIDNDVQNLISILKESSELRRTMADPRIKKAEKKAVIDSLAGRLKLNELVINFIQTISENGRLNALTPLLEAVIDEVKARRGIIDAHIVVANDMGKDMEDALKKSMVKSFGANINLTVNKDESLLGGIVLTVGSLMIDDSVKNKLARLELQMISGQISTIKEVA